MILLVLLSAARCGVARDDPDSPVAIPDDSPTELVTLPASQPIQEEVKVAAPTGTQEVAEPVVITSPPTSGPVASAGCSAAAAPTGVRSASIMVGGVLRTFIVSVPPTGDPSRALALVFGWHGRSWQGHSFRDALIDLELRAGDDAIFVYPDGLAVNGVFAWDLDAGGRDIALFDALLEELSSRYCIDTARVFSFGRSYGGGFANTLACARGDKLRGSSALMGFGPNGSQCVAAVATLIYHNQDDPTVSFALGEASRDFWLSRNGADAATSQPTSQPGCSRFASGPGGRDLEFCAPETGGHWPHDWITAEIWTFFAGL